MSILRTISRIVRSASLLLLAGAAEATDKPRMILQTGLNSPGASMTFVSGGRILASIGVDGTEIKLWDWVQGFELRTFEVGPRTASGGFATPVFTVTPDGQRIIAASTSQVRIWDLVSGRELRRTNLAGSTGQAVLSPDGRRLATLPTEADSAKLWNLDTFREIRTVTPAAAAVSETKGRARSIQVQGRALATDGHKFDAIAFSADGRTLAVCEYRQGVGQSIHTVRISETDSGREIRELQLVEDTSISQSTTLTPTRSLIFSPDGRMLALVIRDEDTMQMTPPDPQQLKATGNRRGLAGLQMRMPISSRKRQNRVAIWDIVVNRQLLNWSAIVPDAMSPSSLSALHSAAFSADGKMFAAATSGAVIRFFDVPGAREIETQNAATGVLSIALEGDGSVVALGLTDNSISIRDTKTGQIRQALGGRVVPLVDVAMSPNGRDLMAGGYKAAMVWELKTGVSRRTLAVPAIYGRQDIQYGHSTVSGGFFSPDGRFLAAASDADHAVKMWDATTGNALRAFPMPSWARLSSGVFSPNGQMLAILEDGTNPEAQQARVAASMAQAQAMVAAMAAARDKHGRLQPQAAQRAMTTPQPSFQVGPVKLLDLNAGGVVRELQRDPRVTPSSGGKLAFSPDGRIVAAGSIGGKIELWDAESGRKLPSLVNDNALAVAQLAFSPDGRVLASASLERAGSPSAARFSPEDYSTRVRLWDPANGKELRTLNAESGVTAMRFSPDGKILAIGGGDAVIRLWDGDGLHQLRTISGHIGMVRSLVFSPDSRLLFSAADDGTARMWSAQSGEELATLVSLNEGADWIAVTPDGLFDGSPAAWGQILWRFSDDILDVAPAEMFFNEFYYPGLIAELVAGNKPKAAAELAQKDRRQPRLKLTADPATSRMAAVRIAIDEAPAGAQDVRLFRNGSLVKVWHGDVLKGRDYVLLEAEIPVVAGENRLTVYAFNRDNIKSLDASLSIEGDAKLARRGVAHILTVGIDHYANSRYDLKYAAADAQVFGAEVQKQLKNLNQYEQVNVIGLRDSEATKAGILFALENVARIAQPEDAVVIQFAGHGTAQDSHFYLIPHDLGYMGERTALTRAGLKTILDHSISDTDIERALEGLDATQPLLVIDACNSGQALEAEEKRRGPMNSKGLAQLAYEKGMYILTAAQSYQAAMEASQLGHGFLTYALVEEGLKQKAADFEPRDGVVYAREWLDYGAARVPQMQIGKMREGRSLVHEIAFVEGEEKIKDLDKRSLQQPRVFYRREMEAHPLVVAKP
jgi:WD40 repeat protein